MSTPRHNAVRLNGGHWRRHGISLRACLAALLHLMAASALGQAEGLKLELIGTKPGYMLGEPVVLVAKLSNDSPGPVAVQGRLKPTYANFRLSVCRGDEEPITFRPILRACAGEKDRILEPGESVYEFVRVFCGSTGWTFKEPGLYVISGQFIASFDPLVAVAAGEMEIKVLPPESPEQIEHAQAMLGAEQGLFMWFEGGDHLRQGKAGLEDLIESGPDSLLAGYASFAIGKSLSEEFFNYHTGKLREPEYEQSTALLRKAIESGIDLYFWREAYFALYRAHLGLGQPALAAAALDEFIARAADRPELQVAVIEARRLSEALK